MHLEFSHPPKVGLVRIALARKPGVTVGQTFGPLRATLRGHQLGDSPRYRELCGFPASGPLPLPWAFVAAAPVQKALLVNKAFPIPLMGMVHIEQLLWARRPLLPGEPLDLTVSAGAWRPARRGIHFDLDTAIHDQSGDLVWWGRTVAWSPAGPGHGEDTPRQPPPELEDPTQHTIDVPGAMGRHYGSVAGDRNPIHVHAWLARPFGFRKAIVHGMWTLGRSLAAMGEDVPVENVLMHVRFRRPVELPSQGVLSTAQHNGSLAFRWDSGDQCCMSGTVAHADGPPTP